jgi:hypothetical protein
MKQKLLFFISIASAAISLQGMNQNPNNDNSPEPLFGRAAIAPDNWNIPNIEDFYDSEEPPTEREANPFSDYSDDYNNMASPDDEITEILKNFTALLEQEKILKQEKRKTAPQAEQDDFKKKFKNS